MFFLLTAIFPLLMNGQDVSPTVNYSGEVYEESKLDKKPEFPGGSNDFRRDIHLNFRIPEIDNKGNHIIRVSFVIETDGTMTNFKLVNDPGFGLGEEAIRVLSGFKKKWVPGVRKNETVRSLYILPIQINIS